MAKKPARKTAKNARKAPVKASKQPRKAKKQPKKKKPAASRVKARPAKAPKTAKKTVKKAAKKPTRKGSSRGKAGGGTGRESTLAQTPETGRSVQGRTNPMPTKRSTGTPSGAGDSRRAPGLERERKRLREVDETVPSAPSSLDRDRVHASAARSGRAALLHELKEHTESSPEITGGDVDADWEEAYALGDEAPGGDNPTPDQDRVDDIGKALGIQYQDNEELRGAEKVIARDKHRWELDPASAEDYPDHDVDPDPDLDDNDD